MHLLFDLDGTLTDSAPGIVRCINHALVTLARPSIAEARLRPMIGTPLTAIFETVLDSDDAGLVDAAVGCFRQRFDAVGIFENALFGDVLDALEAFRAAGHELQIVTATPAPAARRVLEHFAIDGYFTAVHAPALDVRHCDKADLVAAALETVRTRSSAVAMIGDRAEDVRAARRHGVQAVAAGWGYGSADELRAAAPDYLAPTIRHVREWVQASG